MRIGILTNEYPPNVYGGAGVHVEYLTRELAELEEGRHFVRVLSFGDQAERSPTLLVDGIQAPCAIPADDPRHAKLFDTMMRNLVMSGRAADLDIVHCHTWYSHLAGCLVKYLQDVPLVLTTHSLEPHRPWKVEQLGTAYHASSWIERTAYQNADGVIAVSGAMKGARRARRASRPRGRAPGRFSDWPASSTTWSGPSIRRSATTETLSTGGGETPCKRTIT
jgi:glycosyltransferase involved in cell wall biosynthesis